MDIHSACEVIAQARGDAVLVATMGSMVAFDKLKTGQPRLNSVPLVSPPFLSFPYNLSIEGLGAF